MKDHSKKLNEIKESNDLVFEGIFGFGKNQKVDGNLNKNGFLFENEYIKVNPDESVTFLNGSTVKEVVTGWSSLSEVDFSNNTYRWIVDNETKFVCERISIRDGKISFIRGQWNSGEFKGSRMSGFVFFNGFFNGGLFESGQWKPSPFNFINGKWDVDGSILGKKDITNLNQNKFNFNIISVTPGNKIVVQMQDGKSHEITVLKRLDSESSYFSFNVKNSESDKSTPINVRWDVMRGNSEKEFNFNTVFSNSVVPKLFTETFNLKFTSPIVKVIVISSTDYAEKVDWGEKEKTPEELAVTQQMYDLINAPFLGVKSLPDGYWDKGILVKNNIGRIYLNASTPTILSRFENVVKNLNNKVLASDFTQLKSYLSNKIITGAPAGFAWLASLIGKDTVGTKIEDQNFIGSLKRIEEFLRDFVEIIVKYAGNDAKKAGKTSIHDEATIELIKTNLKNFLGIKTEVPTAPAVQTAKAAAPKLGKIKVAESLRGIVREIISGI